ncbi:CinA family protein [Spiroplasma endosymbiont of Aspidapion aeneum]|uniref:CinA family protein n=1 Tax=Spiroplasma endosymbiont of Aspidapion aeneum TaxID=3066276 RepID=UPI00313F0731
MFNKLVKWAKTHGATIAACESFTGGRFGDSLTNISSASQVFIGSFVCYSNDYKIEILGVNPETIKKYGAVSIPCLSEMLKNTYKKTGANVVFGFTGNAPSLRNEDPSLSFVGFLLEKKIHIYQFFSRVPLNRDEYKESAVQWTVNKFLSKVSFS